MKYLHLPEWTYGGIKYRETTILVCMSAMVLNPLSICFFFCVSKMALLTDYMLLTFSGLDDGVLTFKFSLTESANSAWSQGSKQSHLLE